MQVERDQEERHACREVQMRKVQVAGGSGEVRLW